MRSLNSTGCKEGFFIRPPRLRKIELPISNPEDSPSLWSLEGTGAAPAAGREAAAHC